MSMNVLLFLAIRVLHVLLAGVWLGQVFFVTVFLVPTTFQPGPARGQIPIMTALVRRGLPAFMASIGGTTILTGIYLFWRFTGGFDPAVSASRAGMAFSVGALAGVIALILGGSVLGRGVKKMAAIGEKAASAPEAQRGAMMNEMDALSTRIEATSKIVLALLVIAMATMALGHYI